MSAAVPDLGNSPEPGIRFETQPLYRRIAIFTVVVCGLCGSALTYSALPSALPLIAVHFGGGEKGAFFAQNVMTMPSLGMLFGGLVSGFLVDRVSLRNVMLATLLCYAIFGASGLVANSLHVMLASRFLLGLASACLSLACTAFVMNSFTGTARHRALSWQGAAIGALCITAILVGGVLVKWGGWRMPFILYPLLIVPAFMAVLMVVPGNMEGRAPTPSATLPAPSRRIWPILLLFIPLNIVVVSCAVQLPFLLVAKGVVDPIEQAMAVGGGQIFQIPGALLFPLLIRRFGTLGTACVLLAMLAAGFLASAAARDAFEMLAASSMFSLGIGISTPLSPHIIADRASGAGRNRALGWMLTASCLGIILNPPALALLGEIFSLENIYILFGAGTAAIALILGLWANARRGGGDRSRLATQPGR